jgi:hypothetical protein
VQVNCSQVPAPLSAIHLVSSRPNDGGNEKWTRGLRRRSAAARLLGLRVRIPLRASMFVSCVCCVLCR